MGVDYSLKFSENDEGIIVDRYSDDEVKMLSGNVTNLDSNVFAWRLSEGFTPEQAGALISRYSRTSFTSRRLFVKEFYPNKSRGREFFDAWLADFGDDSIQEMVGGLPVSCEYISQLAIKDIEDSRIGSYIEKSTRYVAFDKKLPDNEFMFYKDRDIMNSRYNDRYLELMRGLFTSYSSALEKMMKYIRDTNSIEDISFKISDRAVRITEMNKSLEEKVGVSEDDLRKAYENAVKANALDFVRDYLPLATLSHIGISANARSYENILIKMMTSPLSESRFVANRMRDELSKLAPSVMKGISNEHGMEMQKFISERRDNTQAVVDKVMKEVSLEDERAVLVDYTGKGDGEPDKKAQIALAATIMYRFSHGAGMQQLFEKAAQMSEKERKEIIAAYISNRMNRRHKPGRAFESVDYTFDLTGRIGIYRDLQRHRVCVHERQNFGTELGYDTRKEFAEIGIVDDFKSKMEEVKELYNALLPIMPYQAQYVVAFGYNVKWYYRMNARQFFHVCEIRTAPHGHADYRKLVQSMAVKVKEVHPSIMEHMKYLNMSSGVLNRLGSEIRIAAKKRAISAAPSGK